MQTQNSGNSLIGLTIKEIRQELRAFDQPAFRAKQIYNWIHYKNADSFEEMTDLSKDLREELASAYCLKTLQLIVRQKSADGTQKFLWELYDGRRIESVMIPVEGRITVCISSQVGCALACEFCATGEMGFIRNLTPGEMVEQILRVQQLTQQKVTNVVFMGMGEPFLNYKRVIQACQILADDHGVAIAAKKITISTSGIIPPIYQFSDAKQPYRLAISLHAATQHLREELMPIAKRFPLDELIESAKYYTHTNTRKRISFEYILLDGVNDSETDANQLVRLLSPIRCKLNVIPCNQNDLGYRAPSEEKTEDFMRILAKGPFTLTLRQSRGQDITAACGQLHAKINEAEHPRYMIAKSPNAF
jgi:23S rRNA (adenine2503-C2)-methyltransferase